MDIEDDEIYKALAPLCDTILYLEEIDVDSIYRTKVFDSAVENTDKFMEQVDKKIESAQGEAEILFVYDVSLNFTIFALNRLIQRIPDKLNPEINDALHDFVNKMKNACDVKGEI